MPRGCHGPQTLYPTRRGGFGILAQGWRTQRSIRVHGTTQYNSIYRFDDAMLVNTHVGA